MIRPNFLRHDDIGGFLLLWCRENWDDMLVIFVYDNNTQYYALHHARVYYFYHLTVIFRCSRTKSVEPLWLIPSPSPLKNRLKSRKTFVRKLSSFNSTLVFIQKFLWMNYCYILKYIYMIWDTYSECDSNFYNKIISK